MRPPRARIRQHWRSVMATKFVTSADGTRIAYEAAGQGAPLVFVWGALGVRSSPFAKAMRDELAKDFTVFDYDRRGRGESGDTKPYAVAREVEDLRAVCEAAGGRPYVAATSSGAALALEAAASGVPKGGCARSECPRWSSWEVALHRRCAQRPTRQRGRSPGPPSGSSRSRTMPSSRQPCVQRSWKASALRRTLEARTLWADQPRVAASEGSASAKDPYLIAPARS